MDDRLSGPDVSVRVCPNDLRERGSTLLGSLKPDVAGQDCAVPRAVTTELWGYLWDLCAKGLRLYGPSCSHR